jgi:hypothetical protein
MNLRNKKFVRFSREMMRVLLFVYLYGLGFSVLHHHDGGTGKVCIDSSQSSETALPNPHSETSGGFHECSFLANFFLIHQSTPTSAEIPVIKADLHEIPVTETRSFLFSAFHFTVKSLRAPPLFS